MAFDFEIFGDSQLHESYVEWFVDERSIDVRNHFNKLWEYYQNRSEPLSAVGLDAGESESSRIYVQAQEYGLPARITGVVHNSDDVFYGTQVGQIRRKEVVIENDITWRINAMVDFLFGKEMQIISMAADGNRRAEIGKLLKALFDANGAIGFFQDMAVLGSVYGFVDCLVRAGVPLLGHVSRPSSGRQFDEALKAVQQISLELIEAPRALPILDEDDYKRIRYYVQHFYRSRNALAGRNDLLSVLKGPGTPTREQVEVTEIIGPDAWQRYENKELAAEGEMPWGFVPVVHIQNVAQPYFYEGLSEVEQLIPLQDELNTRLSDRASRITFQAFKMYLAKGLEGVENRPVSPGRMWCTDNTEASIESFGGDAAVPSEDAHIAEVREALDKTSGVTPVVAGVLKNKLGNLTSAVALRMTMLGMLARTDRKRFTYGGGIKTICSMVLEMLDKAGIYKTAPQDRQVDILFPSPIPENTLEKLQEAQLKLQIGVDRAHVLRELGYEAEI
jgi:hypothetical protein